MRKLSKYKKGLLAWSFMIDLIIFIFIFFIVMGFIDRAAERTTYEQSFLARHFALMTETVLMPPGNLEVEDRINPLWFTLSFEKNRVHVYDATQVSKPPLYERAIYPFIEDKTLKFDYPTITPGEKIKLTKSFIQRFNPLSVFYTSSQNIESGQSIKPVFCKIDSELKVASNETCI